MINEIKFRDSHQIPGNLTLNLAKSDGTPYKTIILAGENGCGKTTIFECIANFVDNRQKNKSVLFPFLYIRYTIGSDVYEITPVQDKITALHSNHIGYIKGLNNDVSKETEESPRVGNETLVTEIINIGAKNTQKISKIDKDEEDIRNYGFAFIPVQAVFPASKVTHIGTDDLDREYRITDVPDSNLKQLLVDVFAINAMGLYSEYEHLFYNSNKLPPTPEAEIKIEKRVFEQFFYRVGRFKNAYNNFWLLTSIVPKLPQNFQKNW